MRDKDKWDILKEQRELDKLLERAEVLIETTVYPCEDIDKVNKALDNVFQKPNIERKIGKYILIQRISNNRNDITRIFNTFRKRKVLAAVRRYAKKYSSEKEIVIYINKQSAYAGVLNICEPGESPLGEIVIRIKCDRAMELLDKLTEF